MKGGRKHQQYETRRALKDGETEREGEGTTQQMVMVEASTQQPVEQPQQPAEQEQNTQDITVKTPKIIK